MIFPRMTFFALNFQHIIFIFLFCYIPVKTNKNESYRESINIY